jgi:hypothetical protein
MLSAASVELDFFRIQATFGDLAQNKVLSQHFLTFHNISTQNSLAVETQTSSSREQPKPGVSLLPKH